MSDQPIEFIRLAGYPVRVTSLRRTEGSGDLQIVAITRGSRDPELLREILGKAVIDVEVPGDSSVSLAVAELDVRSSGEGATMVTRFAFTLRRPEETIPATPVSLAERVARLEREVAELRAALAQLLPPSHDSRPDLH